MRQQLRLPRLAEGVDELEEVDEIDGAAAVEVEAGVGAAEGVDELEEVDEVRLAVAVEIGRRLAASLPDGGKSHRLRPATATSTVFVPGWLPKVSVLAARPLASVVSADELSEPPPAVTAKVTAAPAYPEPP